MAYDVGHTSYVINLRFHVQHEFPYFTIGMSATRTTIIAADKNIPFIAEACAELGTVRLYDVRRPEELRAALADADVLLCRSTIRVDGELLGDTSVRFVATATSGTDHLDIPWLERQGITWKSAAGSNARSVAEWLVAVLLQLHHDSAFDLRKRSIGIIGVGHVGSQVARVAEALGLPLILNDPPRDVRGENPLPWSEIGFSTLEDALRADIVTLHTPLVAEGKHATRHLFNATTVASLKPDAVVINTARGDVADPVVLQRRRQQGRAPIALDVFPGEPHIDPGLVAAAGIATPHVAGHSLDGKLLGTQMLCNALAAYLGKSSSWRYEHVLPKTPVLTCTAGGEAGPFIQVHDIVRQVYDPLRDDAALRSSMNAEEEARATVFRTLRAEYPPRREFSAYRVHRNSVSPETARILTELAFQLI